MVLQWRILTGRYCGVRILTITFELGAPSEWREVFPPKLAARLSEWLPKEMKERFGWPN